MKLSRKVNSTSQILQIFVRDSSSTTGAGLAALTNASTGLTAYYHRDTDTGAVSITLSGMTVGTYTTGGFKEIDATNMPGWYQFCPPNAAFASTAASVAFHLKGVTNMAPLPIELDLDTQVDVTTWSGTAVSTPATAGIPDVNIKNMNNIAATSITTINANQGTTQPINFTNTGASAAVKVDVISISAVTVTTAVAHLGVNVVTISSTPINNIADGLLNRDMSAVSDTNARTLLNAARILRNRYSISGTVLTVYKEDDSTITWSSSLSSDATAIPIIGSDPA